MNSRISMAVIATLLITSAAAAQTIATMTPGSAYMEDFESGLGGWTTGGNGTQWIHGTPAGFSIDSAAGGVGAVHTSVSNIDYSNNTSTWVEGNFDMTALSVDPTFSFELNFRTESSWDV